MGFGIGLVALVASAGGSRALIVRLAECCDVVGEQGSDSPSVGGNPSIPWSPPTVARPWVPLASSIDDPAADATGQRYLGGSRPAPAAVAPPGLRPSTGSAPGGRACRSRCRGGPRPPSPGGRGFLGPQARLTAPSGGSAATRGPRTAREGHRRTGRSGWSSTRGGSLGRGRGLTSFGGGAADAGARPAAGALSPLGAAPAFAWPARRPCGSRLGPAGRIPRGRCRLPARRPGCRSPGAECCSGRPR